MNMENLTDEQLSHLIRVVALDLKLKAEIFEQIKILERVISKHAKRPTLHDCCAVCERTFYIFRRAYQCPQCTQRVCKQCMQQNQFCSFCTEKRRFRYKLREWSILCPFKENEFGYAKFGVRRHFESIKELDWIMRAKMELHITRFLNESVDDADVRIIVVCGALERARRMLVSALEEFDTTTPFIHIDDALTEVQANARRGSLKNYPIQADHCSYIQLLSYAVVSFLVARNTQRVHRTLQMSSSLTNEPFRNRYSSSVRSANFAVAGTSSERNWPIRRGYASRAEVVSRAQSTERFNLPPIRNIRNSISSSPSLGDHSQTSEQSCEEEASDLTTELSVRIVHREIHVRTGELVTITSSIHSEEAEVDVKWYNGEKEISNSGRYRLSGKGSQYCLEIFDCDVADRGEISCLAISSTSVASDSVQLFIHEEDMAGEEPMFIEPLTFEQNGMSITLRCSVIGYPIPYLTFHRRNRRIPSDTHIAVKREGHLWTLRVEGCSVDDEGRYAAIARNRIGRAISHCNVLIAHKPPSSYIADV